MKKFNKKRNITFLLVLFLSIGFATLTANLYVNGFALFKGGKFDIHFENVKVNEEGVTPENVEITADDTVEFEASLESPGEFVEFNVDVVNSGKIDGMVNKVEKNNSKG